MNREKKKEKSKLSKLRLRSTASVTKKADSPHVDSQEKISKYFTSSLNEIASQNESEEILKSNTESQYAQKFSSCNNSNDSINDENDFAKPKNMKPAKILKIPKGSKPKKRTRNTNDLTRFIKKIEPSCSDTNQEHLHLALAMSESVKEFENFEQSSENGESQEDVEYVSPYPSTQQKIATIKSTLAQFGFKTDRPPIEIPTAKNNSKQKKKFKYLTPTLFLRTEEERTKLIETKVSGILTNISVYNKFLEESETSNNNEDEFINNKPKSFLLREYYNEDAPTFRKDNLSQAEMKDSTFYNKIVPQELNKPGILLKDWNSIPGREKSPPLERDKRSPINIIVPETEDYNTICSKEKSPLSVNFIVEETEAHHSIRDEEKSPLPFNMIVKETEEHHSLTNKDKSSPINKMVKETEISSLVNIIVEETEENHSICNKEKSVLLSNNIIVEETEEIQYEISRKQKDKQATVEKQINTTENIKQKLFVNTSIDRSISPDLFSDSDSELSINKSPVKNSLNFLDRSPINKNICTINTSPDLLHESFISNLESSPIILQKCNMETSPIVISSNTHKLENSPPGKEILSDDSDARSLSLLDNISPRRNKNKSPKKKIQNSCSSLKKSLFGTGKITLNKNSGSIDGITALNKTQKIIDIESPVKHSSPFTTLQKESQIYHYESFCDNSNDCFDLTRSSDDSNDIFNAKTITNTSSKNNKDMDEPISENLFASEAISTEMGAHDDHYSAVIQMKKCIASPKENYESIDLTQSFNDSREFLPKKKINTDFSNDKKSNKEDDFEETILLNNTDIRCSNNIEDLEEINTVPLQNNFSANKDNNLEDENYSNDSVKTVLLKENSSVANIKDCEEFKIPQKQILNLQSDSFEEEYSPELDCLNPSNNKLFYSSLSFISDSESDKEKSPKKNSKKDKSPINNTYKKVISPKKFTVLETDKILAKKEKNVLKRSFSENIIGDKELNFVPIADKTDFFKLSSPLSITKFLSQPTRKNNILNYKNPKSTYICNQSFEDIEISDEELNYSVRKSKKFKLESSKKVNDTSKSSNDPEGSDKDLNHSINKSKLEDKAELNLDESLEDIEISDEELNYSVRKSKININDISKSSNDLDIIYEKHNHSIRKTKTEPSCSKIKNIFDEVMKDDDINEDANILSQSSIGTCSDISDEELNYSTNVSFKRRKLIEIDDMNIQEELKDNVESFPQFDFNDFPYNGFEPTRTSININKTLNTSKTQPNNDLNHPRIKDLKTPTKLRRWSSQPCIPPNDSFDEIIKQASTPKIDKNHVKTKITTAVVENNVKTPENNKVNQVVITPVNDYIIKTTDVTPMPNFNEMDSPQIIKELDKFGIKPVKRAKGIKLLRYIYEATHPVLLESNEKNRENSSDEEDNRRIKRRKKNFGTTNIQKRLSEHFENKEIFESVGNNIAKSANTQKQLDEHNENKEIVKYHGNDVAESEKVEDMIFERKQSVRISSCRLPLHLAWHNLVSSSRELFEKILLYEPIQVEEIYAQFKSLGFKYHIQDIITFLDRKCVTIRVAQNNHQKKVNS